MIVYVILSALLAAAVTFAICANARQLGEKFGLMDFPDPTSGRKLHQQPTPLMGGLVLILVVPIPCLLLFLLSDSLAVHAVLWWFGIAALGLSIVGLLDDRFGLGAGIRLVIAALVLLADIVEASSRILKNPTPSRIKALIDTRIREVVDDDQLDASNLTFSDLNKIAECFSRILNGIFHHRIEYYESQGVEPGQEEKHKRKNDDLHRKPTEKNTPEFDEDRAVASTNTGASRMRG